jgi:hypothetical protein
MWRVGFEKDPRTAHLNRSMPRTALGSVAHEVFERLGEEGGFEEVWAEAVQKAATRLAEDWAPLRPPSPEHWPGWALTKVRARRAWERNSGTAGSTRAPRRASPPQRARRKAGLPALPWREQWLDHPTLPLAGKPDLVDRIDGDVWVVDLKAGLGQKEATESQRKQLLFYCALVEGCLGEMPRHVAIKTLRGEMSTMTVDSVEVHDLAAHAVEALTNFNSCAADGLDERFAKPSIDNCGWCPFRVACRPFFDSYSPDWDIPHAVVCFIDSLETQEDDSVGATIWLPEWRTGTSLRLSGVAFGHSPILDDCWGIADYAGRASTAIAQWNTTAFDWSQGSAGPDRSVLGTG